jgi:hypothetical protein
MADVCHGCREAKPNMIQTRDNKYYCQRCWERVRDFYELEAGTYGIGEDGEIYERHER